MITLYVQNYLTANINSWCSFPDFEDSCELFFLQVVCCYKNWYLQLSNFVYNIMETNIEAFLPNFKPPKKFFFCIIMKYLVAFPSHLQKKKTGGLKMQIGIENAITIAKAKSSYINVTQPVFIIRGWICADGRHRKRLNNTKK